MEYVDIDGQMDSLFKGFITFRVLCWWLSHLEKKHALCIFCMDFVS